MCGFRPPCVDPTRPRDNLSCRKRAIYLVVTLHGVAVHLLRQIRTYSVRYRVREINTVHHRLKYEHDMVLRQTRHCRTHVTLLYSGSNDRIPCGGERGHQRECEWVFNGLFLCQLLYSIFRHLACLLNDCVISKCIVPTRIGHVKG